MFKKYLILAIVLCFTSTAFTQKVWEKPAENWSKKDAAKILTLSPWSKTYRSTMLHTTGNSNQPIVGKTSNSERFVATQSRFPVIIRLYSALPVRQALVRLRRIESRYDRMNMSQQDSFDAEAKTFLDCSNCEHYHIVSIDTYHDKSPRSYSDRYFQTKEFDDLEGKVRLVSNDGSERELVKFTAPSNNGESAIFYFKRKDKDGNLFVTPKTKNFEFVFDDSLINEDSIFRSIFPKKFSFKVSKLFVDNKIEF